MLWLQQIKAGRLFIPRNHFVGSLDLSKGLGRKGFNDLRGPPISLLGCGMVAAIFLVVTVYLWRRCPLKSLFSLHAVSDPRMRGRCHLYFMHLHYPHVLLMIYSGGALSTFNCGKSCRPDMHDPSFASGNMHAIQNLCLFGMVLSHVAKQAQTTRTIWDCKGWGLNLTLFTINKFTVEVLAPWAAAAGVARSLPYLL